MKYLLDTNVCIRYLNARSAQIRVRLSSIPRVDVGVSIVTKAELFYGSAKSQTPERSRQKQLEFLQTVQTVLLDDRAAVIYGDIRAYLERRGQPIGANDLLIAATALANKLTLVTHNTGEFSRISELSLEDWES